MVISWVGRALLLLSLSCGLITPSSRATNETVSLAAHLKSLEQAVSTMQSQTRSAEQQHALALSSVLEELSQTKNDLTDMKAELGTLKADHATTEHEMLIVTTQLKSALEQLSRIRDCSKSNNETDSSDLDRLKSDLNVSLRDLAAVKTDVKDLRLSVQTTKSNVTNLASELESFKSEVKVNQSSAMLEVKTLDTRISSTQNTQANFQSKIMEQLRQNETQYGITHLKQNVCAGNITFQSNLGYLYNRHIDGNTTIPFQNVILNIGDGFNSRTGVFTAPSPGVYFFWAHVDSLLLDMDLAIMKNKQIIVGGENGYETHTNNPEKSIHVSLSAAVSLLKGDNVSVRVLNDQQLYYNTYSSFGGMLIHC